MFNHPSSRAGLMLAIGATVFSTSAAAAVTDPCQTPYTQITVDGSQGQQALQSALQNSPSDKGVELRLTGQFSITQPIAISRDCVRITSDSAASPATLTWTANLPPSTQPARVFVHHELNHHHLEVRNLSFVKAGVHLAGSDHVVAQNTFSTGHASVSVYIGSAITIERNSFADVEGFVAVTLNDARIDNNRFTHVTQPVSIRSEGSRNTISNNVATGTVYFGIELLGLSSRPGIERFVDNTIVNNSFTAPSQPEPGNHGAYGGISVVAGANNLIKDNTVDCGNVCRAADTPENVAKKLSYSRKGDLIGIGIEVADAKSRVIGNTVRGFYAGIFISNPQSDVSALSDVATLDGNKIYNTNHGIAITCYPGAANGVEPSRQDIGACRRAYVIQNNLVQNARDIGIGGVQNFYYPSTNTPTKSLRYQMNMASESTAITIHNNTVTRSYGAFPGDATVQRPNKRFVAITVGPIINPGQQRVTYNKIDMRGAPPAGSEFGFTGVELMPYTEYDGALPACSVPAGSQTLAGMSVANNTITHYTSPFGKGVTSTCGIGNGVLFNGNTFTGLSVTQDLQ